MPRCHHAALRTPQAKQAQAVDTEPGIRAVRLMHDHADGRWLLASVTGHGIYGVEASAHPMVIWRSAGAISRFSISCQVSVRSTVTQAFSKS